jgi:alkylhydroperoxidase family enzyme
MASTGGWINLYRAMAHSPVAMQRFVELLTVLWSGAVSARQREIAVLSVVSASNSSYPLGWHILDAREAGLTDAEIRATVDRNASVLASADAAIARFARAVTLECGVADEDFAAVRNLFDEQRLVELALIAGLYRAVAAIANALGIELDDEAAQALEDFRQPERTQREDSSL